MEKIIVSCPGCGKKYGLPQNLANPGKSLTLKCKSCSVSFSFRSEAKPENVQTPNPDATLFSQNFPLDGATEQYMFPDDCDISISFPERNGVTTHKLTDRLTILGRTEGNILINDPLLSRKHFSIEVKSSTVIELKDLASRNGTLHNGMRVSSVLLQSGDIIQAGSSEITFSNRIKI
ncbi:MAG: FHA domain-containing protein [Nitrospinota bacterium]